MKSEKPKEKRESQLKRVSIILLNWFAILFVIYIVLRVVLLTFGLFAYGVISYYDYQVPPSIAYLLDFVGLAILLLSIWILWKTNRDFQVLFKSKDKAGKIYFLLGILIILLALELFY